jgi:hypothetical protein
MLSRASRIMPPMSSNDSIAGAPLDLKPRAQYAAAGG